MSLEDLIKDLIGLSERIRKNCSEELKNKNLNIIEIEKFPFNLKENCYCKVCKGKLIEATTLLYRDNKNLIFNSSLYYYHKDNSGFFKKEQELNLKQNDITYRKFDSKYKKEHIIKINKNETKSNEIEIKEIFNLLKEIENAFKNGVTAHLLDSKKYYLLKF
ncbi:MAG: hypothetical protein QXL50_02375 [Candidatus Pacearchaeota archaeon]